MRFDWPTIKATKGRNELVNNLANAELSKNKNLKGISPLTTKKLASEFFSRTESA